MTVYAFDLDGTLERPNMKNLANDLFMAGHDVYVISAARSSGPDRQAKLEKLTGLGVQFTELIMCIGDDVNRLGIMKGDKCRELGVSVMVEDDAQYAYDISKTSPSTDSLMIYTS